MPTATIQPDKILRELNELWDQLDQDQAGSGGVLRACAMTLVVTANDDADAEEVRRTLGVLMHDHPSRAVILKIQDGAEFDARVFAECWKPFGSSQQICSEGVEILSDSVRFEEAAQLLVPLKVPDLPAVLWCRGPSVFQLRSFDTLFPLADKIIVDSSTVSHAAAALGFLRELRARGCRVADLHWTRLTGWREILAHLFDDGALPASEIVSARVVYGGATPSTCSLYFAAWIEDAAPRARVSLVSEAGAPGLHSVALSTAACELSLAKQGASIQVTGCGRHYRASLPPMDQESLMREELKFLGPDPVFERVLT
jgi:glucose-6-phosphate dehydrogenase assembly protein OpcA